MEKYIEQLEAIRKRFEYASPGWDWDWELHHCGAVSVYRWDEGCKVYITGIVQPQSAVREFDAFARSIGI